MDRALYHRPLLAGLTAACFLIPTGVLAQNFFRINNPDPTDFGQVQQDIGAIQNDLNNAMCGGWAFGAKVKGVFNTEEVLCYDAANVEPGAYCRDKDGVEWLKGADGDGNPRWYDSDGNERTNDEMVTESTIEAVEEGFVAKVEGVPGRESVALGNIPSGQGKRVEVDGLQDVQTGQRTGFDFPDEDTTCGFTTLCRPGSHPDRRTPPPEGQTFGSRDLPGFFCDHPCQRPLDGEPPTGKPANWDPADSSAIRCGQQEPYDPLQTNPSTGVKYACGGGETKPPTDNEEEKFCPELLENGPKGGLCQDLNSWVYVLWSKVVHVCLTKTTDPITGLVTCNPVPIRRFEKGPCGFPAELPNLDRNLNLCTDGYQAEGVFECCSDDPYGAGLDVNTTEGDEIGEDGEPTGATEITDCSLGLTANPEHIGNSCKTCEGDECRIFPLTNDVIIPDVWFEPFPTDLPGQCLVSYDECDIDNSTDNPVNHGPWSQPPSQNYRFQQEPRRYISYFRDYNEASYEREPVDTFVPEDDHKKERIPVACYGMYDNHFGEPVPEDAKTQATIEQHKRCTIAGYYPVDDGDGDQLHFADMPQTQRGVGSFNERNPDIPPPNRPFDQNGDIWVPTMGGAFSLVNNQVLEEQFENDLSFAILAPDVALQRTIPQLDNARPFSSGALLRAFDDTTTKEQDFRQDRRTIQEWWQLVETEMHEHFTPPTVRVLFPSTWTIDLDPLDPLFTPPLPDDRVGTEIDPQSAPIEVQIAAREDLMGDLVSFMERNLLLQIEEAPIPVVVPLGSPTEYRALSQGWESWIRLREEEGEPIGTAQDIADKLKEYADRIDDVRALRGELPRYAGELLDQQRVISERLANWLKDNVEAYEEYLELRQDVTQGYAFLWKWAQDVYRLGHDVEQFPWCRNDRFTAPIYSMLDPWLPGRENNGDTTGGFAPFISCVAELNAALNNPSLAEDCEFLGIPPEQCLAAAAPSCANADSTPFGTYIECLNFLEKTRGEEGPGAFPEGSAYCDPYFPVPPLLPFVEASRDASILVDLTPFRESQKTVKLPVLKPTQIRLNLLEFHPPGLEQDEEPTTELPDLPALPEDIADLVAEELPVVDIFKEGAVLSAAENVRNNLDIPKIVLPSLDLVALDEFLFEVLDLMFQMNDEYRRFWEAMSKVPCAVRDEFGCIEEGKEQDCVEPYNDPMGTCVHYEADLKERIQRIGARPAIFFDEDFESIGNFRDPIVHGNTYCAREDWACQLLHKMGFNQREGWQVEFLEEYNQEDFLNELREQVRDATDNLDEDGEVEFIYDIDQKEMYQNFMYPEPFEIIRRLERSEPEPLPPGVECNDAFCEIAE